MGPSHPSRAGIAMLRHKRIPHRVVWLMPGLHPLLVRVAGFPRHTVPASPHSSPADQSERATRRDVRPGRGTDAGAAQLSDGSAGIVAISLYRPPALPSASDQMSPGRNGSSAAAGWTIQASLSSSASSWPGAQPA